MKLFMKVFVNMLTTFRLGIIFLFMILFKNMSSLCFFTSTVLIFLTDFLDGVLARKFEVQTFYGSYMDTIADKFFSIGLVLIIVHDVSFSFFILLGEVFIAVINLIGMIRYKKTKSSILGKIKTWLVAICIILCYFYYYFHIPFIYVSVSCIITFIIQCIVMIQYFRYLLGQKEKVIHHNKLNGKGLMYYLFDTDYYLENR